jgi:hypothetical protein
VFYEKAKDPVGLDEGFERPKDALVLCKLTALSISRMSSLLYTPQGSDPIETAIMTHLVPRLDHRDRVQDEAHRRPGNSPGDEVARHRQLDQCRP